MSLFSYMEVGMPMERKKATVFFMPSRAAFSSSASVTPQTFRAKRANRDGFVRVHSFRPGTPDGGQGSSVGGIKNGGQLESKLMYSEILHAAESGQSVVGERAGPHQLTHGIIVLWILHSNAPLGNDGTQKRFCRWHRSAHFHKD